MIVVGRLGVPVSAKKRHSSVSEPTLDPADVVLRTYPPRRQSFSRRRGHPMTAGFLEYLGLLARASARNAYSACAISVLSQIPCAYNY